MWSGGGWFCEDRKDWSAECSSWCICCWTCECDNCGTSWRAGKFFHWFFNSASMQWYFKFREPATNGEMKVDVAVAYLWIIWFLFDLSSLNGIMTWSGSWVTVFIGSWKWQFFLPSVVWSLILRGHCTVMVVPTSSQKKEWTNYLVTNFIVAWVVLLQILMRRNDRLCFKLIIYLKVWGVATKKCLVCCDFSTTDELHFVI